MKLSFTFVLVAACGGVKVEPAPDAIVDVFPAIVSTTPADGAAGVPAGATITIAFSTSMDRSSVEAAWTSDDLPVAAVDFAWNEASDTLLVTPRDPLGLAMGIGLDPSVVTPRAYRFAVGVGATDTAGNHVAAASSVGFTTQREMTVAFAPLSALTRSMRSDGIVFAESAKTLAIGDSVGNLQTKTFVSFALPVLPAGAMVASATLAASQNSIADNPYILGNLVAQHVNTATINAVAFGATPLSTVGVLSRTATLGVKALDVQTEVVDDLANREPRGQRSQFRLEFEKATDLDGTDDEARFSRTGVALDVVYRVD